MPSQLSRPSSPLGASDEVFPQEWEPVIEELLPPSAEPAATGKRGTRGETSAPHAAVRTFHGKLESIGTLEVLKALTQSRASGIVSFEMNPQGGVLLEDGLIVAASWGELSGARALAQLLLLEGGAFRVGAHLHEVMTEDPRAHQALLLEALQLVAQARAGSGAVEGASRPLARPSPRKFRLPGAKAAGNGKATLNGKALPAGMTAANGNHGKALGSNDGTTARRFLVETLPLTPANGNHTNGKQTPAAPHAHLSVAPSEQNQTPLGPAKPAAPARPGSGLSGPPAAAPLSGEASPGSPRSWPASGTALPAGQLRSKSLWWIDSEPAAPVTELKGETFTRRTLGKLKGARKRLL